MSIKNKYEINRANLSSTVVEYLKECILSGVYKAGSHILEMQVASTLNISRAPVREAIKELEKEGIVETFPRKGTFVTRFDFDDIKEIFEIRTLLENDIFNIVINQNKISDEDIKCLENIVKEMVEIAESDEANIEKSLKINMKDIEFHRYIWNKSASKRRVKILESIFFQLRIAMLYDTNETGDLIKTSTDHYKIIEAIRQGDVELCKDALQEHIITYKEYS